MEARMYKLKIEGIIPFHGFGRIIDEIFVPELGLYMNKEAVFLEYDKENPRYKQGFGVEIVDIKDDFANKCFEFANVKEELLTEIPLLFEELDGTAKPVEEEDKKEESEEEETTEEEKE